MPGTPTLDIVASWLGNSWVWLVNGSMRRVWFLFWFSTGVGTGVIIGGTAMYRKTQREWPSLYRFVPRGIRRRLQPATMSRQTLPIAKYIHLHGRLSTTESYMRERSLRLIQECIGSSWDTVQAHQLVLTRVTGALSNLLFLCQAPGQQSVMMRVYGTATADLFSRQQELFNFCLMAERGLGPALLGMFENGRFEEYLHSRTLEQRAMMSPAVSVRIAARLAQFHVMLSDHARKPRLWATMGAWLAKAQRAVRRLAPEQRLRFVELQRRLRARQTEHHQQVRARVLSHKNHSAQKHQSVKTGDATGTERRHSVTLAGERDLGPLVLSGDESGDLLDMYVEVVYLRDQLDRRAGSHQIVFGHNDLQTGNFLLLHSDDTLVMIDYEYSQPMPRGFDLGNHFCEWASDFSGPAPAVLDFTKYPNEQEQRLFLSAYLDSMQQHQQQPPPQQPQQQQQQQQRPLLLQKQQQQHTQLQPMMRPNSSDGLAPELRPSPLDRLDLPQEFAAGQEAFVAPHVAAASAVASAEQVQQLYVEANNYSLASNLLWGFWGIIQAGSSPIDFDYVHYAEQRFERYIETRDAFLSLE